MVSLPRAAQPYGNAELLQALIQRPDADHVLKKAINGLITGEIPGLVSVCSTGMSADHLFGAMSGERTPAAQGFGKQDRSATLSSRVHICFRAVHATMHLFSCSQESLTLGQADLVRPALTCYRHDRILESSMSERHRLRSPWANVCSAYGQLASLAARQIAADIG